jgi:hypothetical protein
MKKSALSAIQRSEKLTEDLLTKPALVPAFIPVGLKFGEYKQFPTSQAISDRF